MKPLIIFLNVLLQLSLKILNRIFVRVHCTLYQLICLPHRKVAVGYVFYRCQMSLTLLNIV